MATHSSILAWKIPWTGEPGELQCMGLQESDTAKHMHTATPHTPHPNTLLSPCPGEACEQPGGSVLSAQKQE